MEPLPLWVVYERPTDFPDHFVARKWLTDKPSPVVLLAGSLPELRSKLPVGLSGMPRSPQDEPQIVEVWL